ncbi:hypothetical protein AX16_007344 [Volvariella volvacea WC 439]|nr:hypothetical protein AX16_007344 [Volvariella volvacea WC 439]
MASTSTSNASYDLALLKLAYGNAPANTGDGASTTSPAKKAKDFPHGEPISEREMPFWRTGKGIATIAGVGVFIVVVSIIGGVVGGLGSIKSISTSNSGGGAPQSSSSYSIPPKYDSTERTTSTAR